MSEQVSAIVAHCPVRSEHLKGLRCDDWCLADKPPSTPNLPYVAVKPHPLDSPWNP